jgi:uncharacterized protein (DUF2141 family)
MSKTKYVQYGLFMSMLSPALALAELPGVRVLASNLSPAAGTAEITLFNSAESFLKEPYFQQSGKVDEDGSFQAEFVDLPDGEYAVVVVHDANDNGKLDRGFLGFGGESYGYSNQAHSWFGRPDFEDAKFTVDQPGTLVEIDFD